MPPGSTEQRRLYHSFWAKYSGRADNTSMLLNANADELAELDRFWLSIKTGHSVLVFRAEILSLLPDFGEKFVVDIGAGIGFGLLILINAFFNSTVASPLNSQNEQGKWCQQTLWTHSLPRIANGMAISKTSSGVLAMPLAWNSRMQGVNSHQKKKPFSSHLSLFIVWTLCSPIGCWCTSRMKRQFAFW